MDRGDATTDREMSTEEATVDNEAFLSIGTVTDERETISRREPICDDGFKLSSGDAAADGEIKLSTDDAKGENEVKLSICDEAGDERAKLCTDDGTVGHGKAPPNVNVGDGPSARDATAEDEFL